MRESPSTLGNPLRVHKGDATLTITMPGKRATYDAGERPADARRPSPTPLRATPQSSSTWRTANLYIQGRPVKNGRVTASG